MLTNEMKKKFPNYLILYLLVVSCASQQALIGLSDNVKK